jgi:hypothetical protein
MSSLKEIWVAMLTRNIANAGTDNETVLIINHPGGVSDFVHHTFTDTSQRDQQKGEANLYKLGLSDVLRFATVLDKDFLSDSSIRIGIRGDDAWSPEHYFIWGETEEARNNIIPIAIATNIGDSWSRDPIFLSTDKNEGNISWPIHLVEMGNGSETIENLVMLMTTEDFKHAGTDSKIELQISVDGNLVVNYEIPDTPQWEQEKGQANFYIIPIVGDSFSKDDLNNSSIQLRIKGEDAWHPESFFLFGSEGSLENIGGALTMVTLVHMPDWSKGWLSTDGNEGVSSVSLELV